MGAGRGAHAGRACSSRAAACPHPACLLPQHPPRNVSAPPTHPPQEELRAEKRGKAANQAVYAVGPDPTRGGYFWLGYCFRWGGHGCRAAGCLWQGSGALFEGCSAWLG